MLRNHLFLTPPSTSSTIQRLRSVNPTTISWPKQYAAISPLSQCFSSLHCGWLSDYRCKTFKSQTFGIHFEESDEDQWPSAVLASFCILIGAACALCVMIILLLVILITTMLFVRLSDSDLSACALNKQPLEFTFLQTWFASGIQLHQLLKRILQGTWMLRNHIVIWSILVWESLI